MATAMTHLSHKNILYATDFSEASQAALPHAVAIARRFESTVRVVHAITPVTTVVPFEPFPVDYRGPAERQMAALLDSNLLKGVAHDGQVEAGNLWDVLQRLLQERKFDLIVLGSHGRGGVQKLALGSAAEEIIRSAPCPVFAVGPRVPADLTAEFEPRRILCATDLLPDSINACAYAMALAQDSDAHLTFVHALHLSDQQDIACPDTTTIDVRRRLEGSVPSESNLAADLEFVVDSGPTSEVILRTAEDKHADLIVMGVRHTDHPWLSSHAAWVTIHQVLVQASCPVVTVRG